MKTWLAPCVIVALLAAAGAQAQTSSSAVWRCGADGRSYRDTPCPGGLEVAAADPRDAAQTQAARETAAREKRLADQLVREREQREKLAEARFAAPPEPKLGAKTAAKTAAKAAKAGAEPPAAHRKAKRRPPADDGIWRAVAPASRRTKG